MRGLETGLLTFVFFLFLQVGVFHAVKVVRRPTVLFGGWFLVLLLYPVIFSWLPDDGDLWPSWMAAPSDEVTWANGLLLYWFLFMGYMQFIYMAESSVGVRTMIELAAGPSNGMTLEELTERYSKDWMLRRRLDRLIHAGYLTEADGWYHTTSRGRFLASFFAAWKRFLRLGPGG